MNCKLITLPNSQILFNSQLACGQPRPTVTTKGFFFRQNFEKEIPFENISNLALS